MRKFSAEKLDILLSKPTLNASAVAREAGISQSALFQIRKGHTSPRANTIVALADILDVSLDYFFVLDYQNTDKKESA